ncbi:MAG TPA: lysophospholipid acyltransferase family protein [Gemmataceae bacterium]|jgi:hypothetical protein|nr:lysophospholipid acyltransferase family protein [Gemmataceae bacterium]
MKIRHPGLIKALGFIAAWLIRLWMGTLRYRCRFLGQAVAPDHDGLRGRYIYAFWHENLLLPAYRYGRPDIAVLVSQHADGQLIAEICRHLRFRLVRGSTTRGSREALRQLLRLGGSSHLAITPDGPRGPRRQLQPGLVYLAARTGLPIVATGFGFQRPWRVKSWDRFALPRPWTLATCVMAAPISIPPDVDKDQLEAYCKRVEQQLLLVTQTAERWAAGRGQGSGVRGQ